MSTTETRDNTTTATSHRGDYQPVEQEERSEASTDSRGRLPQNMVVVPYTGRDRVVVAYDAAAERRRSLRREIRDLLAR